MIKLTSITNIDKKAIVQYSYPIANITSSTPNVFSLRFNGFNPNFSASFNPKKNNSTYISGVCVKATVAQKRHNIGGSDAELVLEHKTSNNTTFYVVVPLVFNTSMPSASGLDVLFLNEKEDRVVDLNAELKKKRTLFCYKNNGNPDSYIFVFESPIFIQKDAPSNLISFKDIFDGITKNSGFKITNAQPIEDEIECEYVTQTDVNAPPADTKKLTTILSWAFILLGLLLSLIYVLKMVASKAEPDSANSVYMVFGGTGLILLMIYIRLFTATKNKKIEYGSMTTFSLMLLMLSLFAYNGYFKKTSI
jgi:hypothetical protein